MQDFEEKIKQGFESSTPGIIASYKPIPDICQSELARSFKERDHFQYHRAYRYVKLSKLNKLELDGVGKTSEFYASFSLSW